jgi:hypothetical protein
MVKTHTSEYSLILKRTGPPGISAFSLLSFFLNKKGISHIKVFLKEILEQGLKGS